MMMNPYVLIPIPEDLTTEEVYLYLLNTPEARHKIFELAEEARFLATDSVFVDHASLPHPLYFTAHLTDQDLVVQINSDYDTLLVHNQST